MATMLDIGKRYKKTEVEVRDALAAINFAKRITVATKIESSVEQQLVDYWREQDAAADKAKETAAPKPQINRTIGRTEISERSRRVVKPSAPPAQKPIPKPEPVAMMADKHQSTSDDLDENAVRRSIANWAREKKYTIKLSNVRKCESCGKLSYRTKKLANIAAEYFNEVKGRDQEPYDCSCRNGFPLRTRKRR